VKGLRLKRHTIKAESEDGKRFVNIFNIES
jgi:hypothetical protein